MVVWLFIVINQYSNGLRGILLEVSSWPVKPESLAHFPPIVNSVTSICYFDWIETISKTQIAGM